MPKSSAVGAALLSVALLAASATAQEQPKRGPGAIPGSDPRTTAPVNFASPLRSFTVFDKADAPQQQRKSPRSRFLPRFRAGLLAERAARDAIAIERRAELARADGPGEDPAQFGERWAELEEAKEEIRRGEDEVRVEMAYDRATARFNKPTAAAVSEPSSSLGGSGGAYQFVGVVNPPGSRSTSSGAAGKRKITWYARPKPENSKWSLRVVHVDRDAIVRDMFVNGKVDVYGEYVNTGRTVVERDQDGKEEKRTKMPIVEGRYKVKKRSWKNLWNFSPKHYFSDSSGMFWRERRLTPGLYTDGKVVYESAYRYSDGRAGMKPVSNLEAFLQSSSVKRDVKEDLLKRLREDSPDVVIED